MDKILQKNSEIYYEISYYLILGFEPTFIQILNLFISNIKIFTIK